MGAKAGGCKGWWVRSAERGRGAEHAHLQLGGQSKLVHKVRQGSNARRLLQHLYLLLGADKGQRGERGRGERTRGHEGHEGHEPSQSTAQDLSPIKRKVCP